MSRGRYGLWIVLGLALLLRLAPMLCERQVSRDFLEFESIAENLRAGRGFHSDIKAYWAPDVHNGKVTPSPVVHYGLYDRPILLPALLALLRLVLPPLAAAQLIGPLLFLLALALIYRTVEATVGPESALSAGLLLALNPLLYHLSLQPLSEATTILSLALLIWAHYRMDSSFIAGVACTMAFLARPSMLLVTVLMGLVYLGQSVRRRSFARLGSFVFPALVGPVWVVALNRSMGAPWNLLPQSFLFHLVNFQDFVHYFHRGELYPSASALLRAHGRQATVLVAKNALYYAEALIAVGGLGALLALAPIGAAGLVQGRPLRRYGLLALIALLDLGLYVVSWATFDASRFLAIFVLVALLLIALGAHETLDREPLLRFRRAWLSGASYAVLAVAAVWFCFDAGYSYLAVRERSLGRPIENAIEPVWGAPGVKTLAQKMDAAKGRMEKGDASPIVASNEPWLVWDLTRFPSGGLPYDLSGPEWIDFIRGMRADLVVVHEGAWPPELRSHLNDLARQLQQAGWTPWLAEGQILAWMRPLDKKS